MSERTKITSLGNGAYPAKGPVVLLLDANGNGSRAERSTVALCRCEGAHSKVGFRTAEGALRGELGVGS